MQQSLSKLPYGYEKDLNELICEFAPTLKDKYGCSKISKYPLNKELWNINSTQYPLINFRFTFDSGIYRLSSPVLHGLSLGTTEPTEEPTEVPTTGH